MILIDILIGLAFIYLSAALFCSLLHEWIAARTYARAKLLRSSIERMLGIDATLTLYAHPMVDTASESHMHPPSYLTSTAFARAVLDGLRSPADWAKPLTHTEAQSALAQIRHLPLRDALSSIAGAAGNNVTELEKGIAKWFDETMDRASGWYKRRTQLVLFVLGFATAVVFNLDTFRIAGRLWRDPVLRVQLVADAQKQVKDGTDNATLAGEKAMLAGLPFGWKTDLKPLTWRSLLSGDAWGRNIVKLVRIVFTGFPGWLVTALAVSLGAPFWFDLLKRVIDIRGTGAKPGASKKS